MMNVLGTTLCEEGGFEYKKAIVDSFLEVMDNIPDSKKKTVTKMVLVIPSKFSTDLFG